MPRRLPSSEGGKRYPLNMRTTEAMRLKLEAEAQASGRSLAQEVEYCIEQYYSVQKELSTLRKPIVQMIALALTQIELSAGKEWYQDRETALTLRNTLLSIVNTLISPHGIRENLAGVLGGLDMLDVVQLASSLKGSENDGELSYVLDKATESRDVLNSIIESLSPEKDF